jgi:hypothetical protein
LGFVLNEMIPKIRYASNKTDYQLSVKELVAKLDDTHAWSISPPKAKYLPFKISHIDNKAVVGRFYNDSIADLNKLKLEMLLKINNLDVETELIKNLRYQSGSNKNIKIKKYLLQNIQRFRKYCNFDNWKKWSHWTNESESIWF